MSESERMPGYRNRSQVPPLVPRDSTTAYDRPGASVVRWHAAPIPESPAPTIRTSTCSGAGPYPGPSSVGSAVLTPGDLPFGRRDGALIQDGTSPRLVHGIAGSRRIAQQKASPFAPFGSPGGRLVPGVRFGSAGQLTDRCVTGADRRRSGRDAGQLHQFANVFGLLGKHHRDDRSAGTGARCAAGAMQVGLVLRRRIQMDD